MLPGKLELLEPVAEVGGADGLGVVGGEADVRGGDVLARDAVLLQAQPRVSRAPACKCGVSK